MNKKDVFDSKRKCFCVNCGKEVTYSVQKVPDMGGWHNGYRYLFEGKEGRCDICGKMLFPEWIIEYNHKAFNEAIENDNIEV